MGMVSSNKLTYVFLALEILLNNDINFKRANNLGYKVGFSELDTQVDIELLTAKHSLLGGDLYENANVRVFAYKNFAEIILINYKDTKVNVDFIDRTIDIQCYKGIISSVKNLFNYGHKIPFHTNVIEVDLTGIKLSNKIKDCTNMFKMMKCVNKIILGTEFRKLKPTNTASMFEDNNKLVEVDLENIDLSEDINTEYMFFHCKSIKHLDFKNNSLYNVVRAVNMFDGCTNLESIDNLEFGEKLLNTEYMFYSCKGLKELNLSNWDGNVVYMRNMFSGCINLESLELGDLGHSGITSIESAFSGCTKLKSIDLSKMNLDSVYSFANLFYGCKSLENIKLCDMSKCEVVDISNMFSKCGLSVIDLSSINTENIVYYNNLCEDCKNLVSFKIGKLKHSWIGNLAKMFKNCRKLKEIDIEIPNRCLNTSIVHEMFKGCNNLLDNKLVLDIQELGKNNNGG